MLILKTYFCYKNKKKGIPKGLRGKKGRKFKAFCKKT